MRILISGGTGMIGRELIGQLHQCGHELLILTRSNKKDFHIPGVKVIQWDGFSLGSWIDVINNVDAVINLAGENIGSKRWTIKHKESIITSRENAGKILTEAIFKAERKPHIFIQASAIGFYGTQENGIFTEESPIGDGFLADVCEKWEASSEKLESIGIRRIVIRTGVVLSKYEGALHRMLIPFKLFIGGPIGNGRQMVSWIHPLDEGSAIKFLLENENSSGVFNLTAPYPVTNSEIGKNIAKITHRPYWLPVPAFALKNILGEMSKLVLDSQMVLPRRLMDSGFSFKFERIEDALNNIMA